MGYLSPGYYGPPTSYTPQVRYGTPVPLGAPLGVPSARPYTYAPVGYNPTGTTSTWPATRPAVPTAPLYWPTQLPVTAAMPMLGTPIYVPASAPKVVSLPPLPATSTLAAEMAPKNEPQPIETRETTLKTPLKASDEPKVIQESVGSLPELGDPPPVVKLSKASNDFKPVDLKPVESQSSAVSTKGKKLTGGPLPMTPLEESMPQETVTPTEPPDSNAVALTADAQVAVNPESLTSSEEPVSAPTKKKASSTVQISQDEVVDPKPVSGAKSVSSTSEVVVDSPAVVKPKDFATTVGDEAGVAVDEMVTQLLTQNPELAAKLEAMGVRDYIKDPYGAMDKIRAAFQSNSMDGKALRYLLHNFQGRLVAMVPPDFQDEAKTILELLLTDPAKKPTRDAFPKGSFKLPALTTPSSTGSPSLALDQLG